MQENYDLITIINISLCQNNVSKRLQDRIKPGFPPLSLRVLKNQISENNLRLTLSNTKIEDIWIAEVVTVATEVA